MSKTIITIERNSSGVLKNRRQYSAIIVAMTRALEQFANKAHGYKNFSQQPVYNFPVLLVEDIGESDAKKFTQYFSSQRLGVLLNSQNIHMKHNPIMNMCDAQTAMCLKQSLSQNKHAFAVIFHYENAAEQLLSWIKNNLNCPLVYRDNLLIQQKLKMRA